MPPASSADRALHARLLAGDPIAPSELAERFLEPVFRRMRAKFPRPEHEDLVRDLVTDVVLDLAQRPQKYDPARLGLESYLAMDARGDILNRLRSPAMTRLTAVPLADVELFLAGGNDPADEVEAALLGGDALALPEGVTPEAALARIRAAFPDRRDREALVLIEEGERKTAVFARLYGLAHLDAEAQERAVKRQKDRIKMKKKRLLQALAAPRAAKQRGRGAAHTEAGDGGF